MEDFQFDMKYREDRSRVSIEDGFLVIDKLLYGEGIYSDLICIQDVY